MIRCLSALLLVLAVTATAQERPTLTIDQITQDPATWIGDWPEAPYWTDAGDRIYFTWNPRGRFPGDSLFSADPAGGDPTLVPAGERRQLPPRYSGVWTDRLDYGPNLRQRVFERGGDLYLYNIADGEMQRVTQTTARESTPRFSPDGRRLIYREGDQLFAYEPFNGGIRQLTDLRSGNEPKDREPSEQDVYLRDQQRRLLGVIERGIEQDSLREIQRERDREATDLPPTHYIGDRRIGSLQIDPTEQFVAFTLSERTTPATTSMSDYVTESGYVEEITARAKVGSARTVPTLHIQDLARDTVLTVDLTTLPGAFDAPDFLREDGHETDSTRQLFAIAPSFSPDGQFALVEVRTVDNKDRWMARLDPASGTLTALHRDRDEAWIAGPGIAWWGGGSAGGWLPDGQTYWFQSERSGWSHLYTVNVETGEVRQLTDGAFEVSSPQITRDGTAWIFQSSEGDLAQRHVYRMPLAGGERTRLTRLPGRHDFALSPDDQTLALLSSRANQPPEVYVRSAFPTEGPRQAPIVQITDSVTDEWRAYPWRDTEIVTFPASDGAQVPTRIYRPENPNGAAVFFVHGAGYLQNAHKWWSSYFREYQFHNLLADAGYLVLDIDYRASAGYGRDWRTAIYRHMGGRDLQDYVDASRWVGEEFGIDPERVAIYGGSYGGFITLMALFTEPEHFGGGAALRSVTDWAHYNDTYTRNILNTPVEDPEAFERSSPIEFADGLEDPLLMTHGLVDDNVQPQDIFRLSQRLIELGKRDWELALAPVEPHGYREPTSWADKLHRIYDLIQATVGPEAPEETEG